MTQHEVCKHSFYVQLGDKAASLPGRTFDPARPSLQSVLNSVQICQTQQIKADNHRPKRPSSLGKVTPKTSMLLAKVLRQRLKCFQSCTSRGEDRSIGMRADNEHCAQFIAAASKTRVHQ